MSTGRQSSVNSSERRQKSKKNTYLNLLLGPNLLHLANIFYLLSTSGASILGNYDFPLGSASAALNGIIQVVRVWPGSVKHLNQDQKNGAELISTEAELKSGNNQLVGHMRNSPENTLTPLELTAAQDWIQVPNPRRQLPTPPLRLSFIWWSGAAMGCQRGQRGCCG